MILQIIMFKQVDNPVDEKEAMKIISGSYDKSVKVWDMTSGMSIQTLNGHSHYVRSVTVSK